MGPPALNRVVTDEHYPPYQPQVETAYGMVEHAPNGVALDMLGQQVAPQAAQRAQMQYQDVDMANSMPSPVSPNGSTMMYSDVMMQQAMQQAMQQGHMQQWQHGGIQYVPVPQPVPVQMMPQMVPQMVPVQMPMNFTTPGPVNPMQPMQSMQYYTVPQGVEPPREEAAAKGGDFLESLMPKGWRKRQRPSKRPASRVQKVPNGRKIFVGGMSPNSTAESLIKHFSEFGKISDASVIHEAVSRKSRGFGYVEFADKIPDGLLDMEHFIDQRRCGVRGYNYDPADDVAASAA
jgi:hypothetical protein